MRRQTRIAAVVPAVSAQWISLARSASRRSSGVEPGLDAPGPVDHARQPGGEDGQRGPERRQEEDRRHRELDGVGDVLQVGLGGHAASLRSPPALAQAAGLGRRPPRRYAPRPCHSSWTGASP